MSEKLTNEEIQQKADELSKQFGVKVHPLVFIEEEEQIVGYIKEPNRVTKLRVLDKAVTGSASAAAELLEVVLIKEHSNRRIYSEEPEDDKIFIGAAMACIDTMSSSLNQWNKKK